MHFPSDHHRHTHHRRDEGQEDRGSPPPPVHHVSHQMPLGPPPPFPPRYERDEFMNDPFPPQYERDEFMNDPPPPFPPRYERDEFMNDPPPRQPEYTTVQHISHQPEQGGSIPETHHFTPHMPSFLHHHDRTSDSSLSNQTTCRVFCKAHSGLSLAVVDAKVVLATADSSDPLQHWYKDEKYSTQVKDQVGFPSFSLVNKATGQAIKHSLGAGYPVQLVAYNSNTLDESVLWTLGKDLGDGFRAIRMINNIHLNFMGLNADKKHGGVHSGTVVGLGEWKKTDNEHLQWNVTHYCESEV
ncbi:unnamed protein product [Rhodiola kirilowii]